MNYSHCNPVTTNGNVSVSFHYDSVRLSKLGNGTNGLWKVDLQSKARSCKSLVSAEHITVYLVRPCAKLKWELNYFYEFQNVNARMCAGERRAGLQISASEACVHTGHAALCDCGAGPVGTGVLASRG